MTTLTTLLNACLGEQKDTGRLLAEAEKNAALWERWLVPIDEANPVGADPGYDDDFQTMRDELNKLSGIDTELMSALAEKLLCGRCKDIRVATWYLWARLHRDGEAGLADGLALLAALVARFGETLLPARGSGRKKALEWLAGSRMLDSLSLYPEVARADFERIIAALLLLRQHTDTWPEDSRPGLGRLYAALDVRLAQSGGLDALVPQNSRVASNPQSATAAQTASTILLQPVQSGRDLLEQAKTLARYLRDQPQGWLAAHHLIKAVRWDTIHQLPPLDAAGRTRLAAPRGEYRAQLKRLWLQQSWQELLEHTERMFAEGVNHFWLDLQWYVHQALSKSAAPLTDWNEIIKQDLRLLLERLPGLESLAYSDGSPFADEVTLAWISQQVQGVSTDWGSSVSGAALQDSQEAVLQLEAEALTLADTEGIDAALAWLQTRPGISTPRQQWLLRLVMSRVAEQYGKNEMAVLLLGELVETASGLTLPDWEPELIFEATARRLKLLRARAQRSEKDRTRFQDEMEKLLATLIRLDPARAVVLCG